MDDVTIYRDIAGRRVSDVYMIHKVSKGRRQAKSNGVRRRLDILMQSPPLR